MKATLRPHQVRAIAAIRASFMAGCRRPMVSLPTGAGKTVIAAAIIEGALAKGKRVLFVAPFLSLIDQTVEAFAAQDIASVGVMQGYHPLTDGSQPVQVCSMQTLQRRRLPKADLVIVDEAHRWYDFLGKWMAMPEWSRVPFIGLSATPWTKGLGKHYDDLIVAATMAPLVDPLLPDSFEKLPGATWGERYDQALGIQRGRDKAFDEAHPYVSGAAQLAGAVGSAGAAIATAPVAAGRALGVGAETIPGQIAAAGTSGLGVGSVQGFGNGEGGFGNRVKSAATEGVMGAGLGVVALPAGALVGKGANAVMDAWASRGAPISRQSQNLLQSTLADQGMSMDDALKRARDLGPNAMLADTGEAVRLTTEQLAHTRVPGRTEVIGALKGRAEASGDRIGSAYDAALGPRPNVQQTLATMTKTAKDNADVLYGQARKENAPVDVAPVLQAIDGQLLTPAERIAGPSGLPTDEVDNALAWVRSHLSDGASQRTGIDRLDRLERRLRSRTKAAFEGGKSDVGHALNEVGKVLRGQMKASSPVYAQARETFSDDSAVMDAFTAGQKLFSSKTHPDFLAAEMADMSQAERDALKLGVRAAVDETMGRVRNGATKGRQLLDADWNERKILTALGEEDGRALINALDGESTMAETASQVLGNSASARRMQNNPFSGDAPALPRAPQGIAHGAFTLAQKGVDVMSAASKERLARELGPVLTATGDERDRKALAIIEALGGREKRQAAARKNAAIYQALTRGGALSLDLPAPR